MEKKISMRQQCALAVKKGYWYPGLHEDECYQEVEGGERSNRHKLKPRRLYLDIRKQVFLL